VLATSGDVIEAGDIVELFKTHSTYQAADEPTRRAILERARRGAARHGPGSDRVDLPTRTLAWKTRRRPRAATSAE